MSTLSAEASRLLAGPVLHDLVIVGATPAGIMAAIAAARAGLKQIVLLERTAHIGGLPANGLGATDIATKGGTGGLFMEFVNNILAYYTETYGADSPQVKDCTNGYHFEPSVAEKVLHKMLEPHKQHIQIRLHQQLETCKLDRAKTKILSIEVQDISKGRIDKTPKTTSLAAKQFIDATYEGDLLALAGVPFDLGREPQSLYNEPGAGVIYKYWGGPEGPGSTHAGDKAIQAYNYRMCLTDDPEQRVSIGKPATYNRAEYVSLIDDLHTGRFTGVEMMKVTPEMLAENKLKSLQGQEATLPGLPRGLRRLLNPVKLPNGKTDSNNQHWAFISSDLPEENWPYPTASWAWRDKFAERLRDYTLGLIYFAQQDPEVPAWYRDQIKQWGLAKTEYTDNNNFPRQVYVREGRRMQGMYQFRAQDALSPRYPDDKESRPKVHLNSITASHYALDSHACYKRKEGQVHLDGFLSFHTKPYTVPVGVMLPKTVRNLVVPVAVSGTHIGFSTLRMEPCWMALGQAAGLIAAAAITERRNVQDYNDKTQIKRIQQDLVQAGAVLAYFQDVPPSHPVHEALQMLTVAGLSVGWEFKPNDVMSPDILRSWIDQLRSAGTAFEFTERTFENRSQAAMALYEAIK